MTRPDCTVICAQFKKYIDTHFAVQTHMCIMKGLEKKPSPYDDSTPHGTSIPPPDITIRIPSKLLIRSMNEASTTQHVFRVYIPVHYHESEMRQQQGESVQTCTPRQYHL